MTSDVLTIFFFNLKNSVRIAFRATVTELEMKTENVWMQLNNLSDHFIKRRWPKRHLALTLWWNKRHFLVIGGTKVVFLGIGGTKVDLVEGGKNAVVAVAKTSQEKKVRWEKSRGIV